MLRYLTHFAGYDTQQSIQLLYDHLVSLPNFTSYHFWEYCINIQGQSLGTFVVMILQ